MSSAILKDVLNSIDKIDCTSNNQIVYYIKHKYSNNLFNSKKNNLQ